MLRPKKLDIFIAKQFGLLFVGTFFICQFVLMMQFLWRYIDDLIGKGLSMEVLAQFFWYMGLMLVPQALPLAILLSSLITFGNLGESSELTAIKAAGISLMKAFRSVFYISIFICLGSFYFQNFIGPQANMKLAQLLISMRQKSPELEIPEGIFYDGIPNSNLYVQKKDMESGMLYGIMIYRMTGSYEDQTITLADSGMLQSTADKKHLLLTLYDGEWFENMRTQEFGSTANVPFRRETFSKKKILIDYDGDFNMTDASLLSNNARGKSLWQISESLDSMNHTYDSIGAVFYDEISQTYMNMPKAKTDVKEEQALDFDSLYAKLNQTDKRGTIASAVSTIQSESTEMSFRSMITTDGDKIIRQHKIEYVGKFTLALSCLLFFFIGAPLGAIIRKGGLGLPVIISVLVFIAYYILDNSGTRMAKLGAWSIWFGTSLAMIVLIPLAVFVTYKANSDSVVFNFDSYKEFFMKLFGLRTKRHIFRKEVIINDPDYAIDATTLREINAHINDYNDAKRLRKAPNPIRVFFKYEPDHEIEHISEQLESVIEDMSNTRDKYILSKINDYPIMALKSHTRPFEKKWKNIIAAIILPLGVFFYIRMYRFRLRLYRDLTIIRKTNVSIARHIEKDILTHTIQL